MNRRPVHPRSRNAKELARQEPKPRKSALPAPPPKPVKRAEPTKVDTTPPWPFPKREVILKSSEWPAIWKKIRDRTSRDLERDNAQAQDSIKEALDQRDELQARFTTLEAAVKHAIASLQGHAESTAANLKLLTGLIN